MQYTVSLTSKGQMTLPRSAWKALGLHNASQITVESQAGHLVVRKAPDLQDIWELTKSTKRWPGDRAVDQLLADAVKADHATNKA